MIEFDEKLVNVFIATIRKYMQLRGDLNQKDLAEKLDIGISTMSRFLNQKTKDLDEQLIAKMVAMLEIPLHEIIDFVEEESTDQFKRLVNFYKGGQEPTGGEAQKAAEDTLKQTKAKIKVGGRTREMTFGGRRDADQPISEKLKSLSPRQKAYLTDFLDMDAEGRDLIVDLGNSIFRYFKQVGLEL